MSSSIIYQLSYLGQQDFLSWFGSRTWKSLSVKVMNNMLLLILETLLTDRMTHKGNFLGECEVPSHTNPPKMVFIILLPTRCVICHGHHLNAQISLDSLVFLGPLSRVHILAHVLSSQNNELVRLILVFRSYPWAFDIPQSWVYHSCDIFSVFIGQCWIECSLPRCGHKVNV